MILQLNAMETLVIVEQYSNEFFTRFKNLVSGRFWYSMNKEEEAKTQNQSCIQSGTGFRPTPLKISSVPVNPFSNPRSPPPSTDYSDTQNLNTPESDPIPINSETCNDLDERRFYKRLSCPELWAGPTYSNSPPASSLPMPNFPIRRNRTTLGLLTSSVSESVEEQVLPIVKSAPPSPIRGHHHPSSSEPFHGADSATRTLRRILNLDVESDSE